MNKERGIVSSRVALLLRSAEIKPLFYRFVPTGTFEEGELWRGDMRETGVEKGSRNSESGEKVVESRRAGHGPRH